ncbi:hypothetical protein [Actinacidiphila sp. ITFR-21]|uniref:hypothetical protein n=1 Tax=Actinacidiphila sp. ITFR-21 TaxID=3075199 RepID=UPI002889AADA|nr:hypothetical protein [Streptomyces sp. ITFR-21]WNI19153.1 hypothetical protein RLT57_28860 [Streptomyces sp. ITFR-21]
MSLDLTAPGRYDPEPHWRRYLADNGRIIVVCVQDFDYGDYDAGSFIDQDTFATREEAEAAPIQVGPLLTLIETSRDFVVRAQALRLVLAAVGGNGVAVSLPRSVTSIYPTAPAGEEAPHA